MNPATRFYAWLLQPSKSPSPKQCVIWWEKRRIPVNLLVLAVGIISFIVFVLALSTSGHLEPGEDIVEPIGLLFALFVVPVTFNICYTFGWGTELVLRHVFPAITPKIAPRLLLAGLLFSWGIVSIPAVFWVGYRCLQMLRLLK